MRRFLRLIGLIAVVCALSASVPSASGQYRQQQPQRKPARTLYGDPGGLPKQKPWKPWLVAVLCTLGITAIAFKKPGRSHLD